MNTPNRSIVLLVLLIIVSTSSWYAVAQQANKRNPSNRLAGEEKRATSFMLLTGSEPFACVPGAFDPESRKFRAYRNILLPAKPLEKFLVNKPFSSTYHVLPTSDCIQDEPLDLNLFLAAPPREADAGAERLLLGFFILDGRAFVFFKGVSFSIPENRSGESNGPLPKIARLPKDCILVPILPPPQTLPTIRRLMNVNEQSLRAESVVLGPGITIANP